MPRQIPFIIASEGCERFSYYGMRNILYQFLPASMLMLHLPEEARGPAAKEVFHTFAMGVYFFPLLGGWLADRFFGKFNTILWFSLIYCAGHGLLALFDDNATGFYSGLFLIALGAGGIKPLVASFVGDQFDERNKHLAKVVFDAFYWIINFGSFFASLLMPVLLAQFGPEVAFGIPGLLMLVATLVLYAGRRRYVMVQVQPPNPNSFMNVVKTALFRDVPGAPRVGTYLAVTGCGIAITSWVLAIAVFALDALGWADLTFLLPLEIVPTICLALVILLAFGGVGTALQLERARGIHPDEAVDGVRSVLGVLIVFALVTPFHSLFDQKATTWVEQGKGMDIPVWELDLGPLGEWQTNFLPAQMQAFNPLLVMLLIPFNNLVLYPFLRRRGWAITSLRRMTWGIVVSGVAWIVAGGLQLVLDGGDKIRILWQILPYALLTFGEVLVSATGLEFAYSQAPLAMKGVIMSFWNLTTTVGNLWVLLADAGVKNQTVIESIQDTGISVIAFQMFFFAGFAFAAAAVFKLYVRRYKVVDNYRTSEASKAAAARAGKGDAEAEPLPEARVHKDDDRT
jgi:POT family proton-dependent oligopeptide transporter